MRRVYGIWLVRRLGPVIFFQLLFLALALHLFGLSVFVAKVAENVSIVISGDPLSVIGFIFSAFLNARLGVKVEIFVALLMGALLVWSIKRAVVSYEMIRRAYNK